MNRRGFIGKAMAALAGLFGAIHFASANEGAKREVSGITTGLGINFYDLAAAAKPKPRRRVLVMETWWIEREDSDFSMVRSDIATQEMREANPFKPRKAIHWRYIQFEELRKGDHFRLIDEVPQDMKSTGNEDGKTVSVALEDAYNYRKGDPEGWSVAVDANHDYPGKGAGFEWYDWPLALRPLSKKTVPRAFPYRFD